MLMQMNAMQQRNPVLGFKKYHCQWYFNELVTDHHIISYLKFSDLCMHVNKFYMLDCRKNMYDGITEYWVTVRERGSYEEEHEMSEMHKSTSKACFNR